MNADRFAAMTNGELYEGMTDGIAALSYRTRCEDELKRRGRRTRTADGRPLTAEPSR